MYMEVFGKWFCSMYIIDMYSILRPSGSRDLLFSVYNLHLSQKEVQNRVLSHIMPKTTNLHKILVPKQGVHVSLVPTRI